MLLISCNGKLCRQDEPVLPAVDRGFLFGDGVFTTLRVNEGVVENIGKHLARLKSHGHSINITVPEIPRQWIKDIITENGALQGIWRLKIMVTGGTSQFLGLQKPRVGDVILTLTPCDELKLEGCKLVLLPFPFFSATARIKSLASLDRLWIKDFARMNGAQDTLVTMHDGVLLETAFSNVFWISKSVFYTPAFELPLLKGTYLSAIMEGVTSLGFAIKETKASAKAIPDDAAVYVCNSMGIQAVDSIENSVFKRDDYLHTRLTKAVQVVILSDQFKVV